MAKTPVAAAKNVLTEAGAALADLCLLLLFWLLIVPLGALLRLGGFDPLKLRPDAKAASYWQARRASPDAGQDLRRQR